MHIPVWVVWREQTPPLTGHSGVKKFSTPKLKTECATIYFDTKVIDWYSYNLCLYIFKMYNRQLTKMFKQILFRYFMLYKE